MRDKILEKFNDMKIAINTKTREEYDSLMKYLEGKGFRWIGGELPTSYDVFRDYDSSTCISIGMKRLIYSYIECYQECEYKIISYQEFNDEMEGDSKNER